MILTERQKEILIALNKLLVYGNSKLSATSMDYKKVRSKKQVLFLMAGAVQSYSEAILKLITPPNIYDKASEVLFRALMETIINLSFIYSDKTQLKALLFMVYSSEEKIDFAKKHSRLMVDYPSWDLTFGPNSKPGDWDEFIKKENEQIRKAERFFKKELKNKFPKRLAIRAKQADEYLKAMGQLTEKNSQERQYILFYKYFSQSAHLTMPGLEKFLRTGNDGKSSYIIDGNGEDLERICAVVYGLYLDFLRFFLKEYKIYNKNEYKPFVNDIKSILKKRQE